jgi:mannosyltransferase
MLEAAGGPHLRARRPPFLTRADAALLVGITAAAAAIRFSTLGVQSLDHDEAVTALRVLQPTLGGTLHVVAHLERSPPLYYILAWIWAKPLGFGIGPVDLRALSAILGTLTVPVAFLAARELASTRAGLIAAVLVALNPYLIWYSQEARSYGLMVLLSGLSLYLFARALRRPSPAAMALWAGASAVALCSHYFAAFIVLPEAAWLLLATRPRRWALAAATAVGATGLALVPLALTQEGSERQNQFRANPVIHRAGEVLLNLTSSAGAAPALRVTAAVVEAGLALIAVVLVRRYAAGEERRGAAIAVSVAAAAFALPLLLAYAGVDFVDPRNMIGVLVPLLVAAAIAFGTRFAGGRGILVAAAAALAFAAVVVRVNVDSSVQRTDWRDAAAAIGQSKVGRAIVMPRLGVVPIRYYLHEGRPFQLMAPPVAIRILDTLAAGSPSRPPDHGFRRTSVRRVAGEFSLSTFQVSRPTKVTARELQRQDLIGEPSRAMLTGTPRRHPVPQ